MASLAPVVGCGGGGSGSGSGLPATHLHPLAVQGTELVDTSVQPPTPVRLQGFSLTSGSWDEQPIKTVGYYQDESDFERIKSWGANAVTLYMDWEWFDPVNSKDGWDWLDKTLGWCRKHDLYVIPTINVFPGGGYYGDTQFWASQSAQDSLKSFWVDFVGKYSGRPEIAGVDITMEPVGAANDVVVAYQTEVIDAIRNEAPGQVVFIQPHNGDASNLVYIDRPGLVYSVHFYTPLEFNYQGYPWFFQNSLPLGVEYPGDQIPGWHPKKISPLAGESDVWSISGLDASNWTQATVGPITVPSGAEYAMVQLSASSMAATDSIWIDQVEYSFDNKSWSPVDNGSFEAAWSSIPDYWTPSVSPGTDGTIGTIAQDSTQAHDQTHSVKLAGCTGNCSYLLGATIGVKHGIPVSSSSGKPLYLRAWFRGQSSGSTLVVLTFQVPDYQTWSRGDLEKALDDQVLAFRNGSDGQHPPVPVMITEFTVSHRAPRQSVFNYLGEYFDWLSTNQIGWIYYNYRDTYAPDDRVLGIYNCAAGTATSDCYDTEDTEMLKFLEAKMTP
jgi:hypothetical protein